MYQGKVTIAGKEVTITAGREKISSIMHDLKYPLTVTQCTRSAGGMTMYSLFGQSWSWDEFPGLKLKYDVELAEYAASLPVEITARTTGLPSTAWADKYIPLDTILKSLREARKTPEETAREEANKVAQTKIVEEMKANSIKEKAERDALETQLREKYYFLDTSESSSCNRASKNIKRLLLRLWPDTVFSVTSEKYSGGDSLTVRWTDGPCQKQVSEIADNFLAGHFDGMTDSYNYTQNAWHIFGDTRYMHYKHDFSPAAVSAVVDDMEIAVEKLKNEKDSALILIGESSLYLGNSGNGRDGFSLWGESHIVSRGLMKSDSEGIKWVLDDLAAHYLENTVNIPSADLSRTKGEKEESNQLSVTGKPTISRNEAKNGIEIRFPSRPSDEILSKIREMGFRWSRFQKLHYARFSENLFNQVMSIFA
jgi:hypothetical protein